MKLDELLEVLGLLCLVAFAFCIWPPAALLVAGVGFLIVGWALGDSQKRIKLPKFNLSWLKRRTKE